MDTDAQLSERDRSPHPLGGEEQRSRSSRISGLSPVTRLPRRAWRWLTGGGPLRRAGVLLVCCLAFLMLVSSYVVQPFVIPSGSMENTLRPGDRVLVNKLAYRFGDEPRRGDVVVFDGLGSFVQEKPAENAVTTVVRKVASSVGLMQPAPTDYVKRVVGVGGDRVVCDHRGRLSVNGRVITENYLFPGDTSSRVPFDVVVPEGRLWVMGDHRSASRDGRDHLGAPGGGMVPVDRVIGRADWIGWPFGRWSSVEQPDAFADVPEPRPGAAHGGGARGAP
ncbi:signal peptidase I [Streptomyces sp. I05A-00742]|uniref:signal peptidase I n=1 Tax=Streptomyces sp. I05A-00742 TaxID=2732853 RepID=UPI001489A971|nr:signal peptidase I [Streptomyces sp. I05A-00742]